MSSNFLTLELLREAVSGRCAAIRRITKLAPIGEKIFPPTYEGGEYADEDRQVRDGANNPRTVATVLLDSVQSQANRMELALLRAYDRPSGDKLKVVMPMLQVKFDDPADIGRLTGLEAPHRMCDAIFRDSELEVPGHGFVPFRQSALGQSLDRAKASNATPVFGLCPTALLFGFWDSTGPMGGLGAKLQRALVSEIVGFEMIPGKRTSSRLDPLQIDSSVLESSKIYRKGAAEWTFNEAEAARNEKQEPIELKPSEINHGNITPSFRDKSGKLNHGGVTVAYAEQQTVLSLAALRRLKFPLAGGSSPEVDNAARTVLASLGVLAICLLDMEGYDLRSRCLLDGPPGQLEFIGGGVSQKYNVTAEEATALFAEASIAAVKANLPWPTEPIQLQPSEKLRQLVSKSREKSKSVVQGD